MATLSHRYKCVRASSGSKPSEFLFGEVCHDLGNQDCFMDTVSEWLIYLHCELGSLLNVEKSVRSP